MIKVLIDAKNQLKLLPQFKLIATKILPLKYQTGSFIIEFETVSQSKIQKLNAKYLKNNRPTDVISLRFDDAVSIKSIPQLLGKIYICRQEAKDNALDQKVSLSLEMKILFGHGLMHLIGFDHEKNRQDWNLAISSAKIKPELVKNIIV